MGFLSTRPKARTVAAARVQPAGASTLGTGALALAGFTADPLTATPVTRTQALSWPALNNGVRVYTTIVEQLPLGTETGGSDDTTSFLKTLDSALPPGWTCAKTVEALIFHGASHWLVLERFATGFPKLVEFVDEEIISEHTQVTGNGVTKIDHYSVGSEPWKPADVIKFTGVLPGILQVGAAAIRTALANIRAAQRYAENPAPHIYLTDDDGAEGLETEDALAFLQALADAVTTHGSAYLSGLKLNSVGWSAKEIQLVEARNQDAVEAARLLGLPTYYVAAPNQGSSLTYSNQVDVRRDVISALASFAGVIEGRLSLPDVTPRGTTVKFDAASFYQQVTPAVSDNATTTQTPPTEPGTPV